MKELARLNRAVERARLNVPITKRFRLAQAADAHRRAEKGHLLGRVVLEVAR